MVLRHDEQAQSLGPRSSRSFDAYRPGQHEVDDVLAQVVLAGGDEALDALDVPGAVGLRDGQVRPAPTSEPASGSVSTMVAFHWRSIIILAIFWSRSVPYAQSTDANFGPAL